MNSHNGSLPDKPLQINKGQDTLNREQLLAEEHKNPDIITLIKRTLRTEESHKVPRLYYMKDGILMRKWLPQDEEWIVVHQIFTEYNPSLMV